MNTQVWLLNSLVRLADGVNSELVCSMRNTERMMFNDVRTVTSGAGRKGSQSFFALTDTSTAIRLESLGDLSKLRERESRSDQMDPAS